MSNHKAFADLNNHRPPDNKGYCYDFQPDLDC